MDTAAVEVGGAVDRWLASLASKERPNLAVPFRWGAWIFASDGHVAGAIPDDGREAGPPPFPATTTLLDRLTEELVAPARVEVGRLREWAGPAPEVCPACTTLSREASCRRCHGSGHEECFHCGHDMDCEECEGEGVVGCPKCDGTGEVTARTLDRIGTIAGKPFNRRLLARLLSGCPGEHVELASCGAAMDPVLVRGDGWAGLIMPIRHDYATNGFEQIPENVEVRAIEELATPLPTTSVSAEV